MGNRVLVVDDEKSIVKGIRFSLEQDDMHVDCAYDGEEAIDYVKNYSYDLIIMDVMMPKLNGLDATKKIRSMGIPTPIILLTAKSLIDDKVNGLDAGADDYLTKPFQMKELLARIRALLRRGNLVASEGFGDFTLDPNTFEIAHDGKSYRLTGKEYKLMELFIRNSNIFLSTERILESIWEYDSDVDISVVWVFISSLRKHLERIGSNVTIKVSRGVGYRLEENKK